MSAHARTDGFKTLLDACATACGLDPSRLGAQEGVALAQHLTRAAREIWRAQEWTGTIKTEARAFRDLLDDGASYIPGDEFYDDQADEYRLVTVACVGLQVREDGDAYSSVMTTFAKTVPLQNTGDTTMREILSVWDDDPETDDTAQAVGYHLRGGTHVVFGQDAPNIVHIRFRLPAPEFSISMWNNATAYTPGNLVFVLPHCYMCMVSSTGSPQGPASAPARWEVQDVPECIRDVVITDAARAWLRAEGRYAQAGALGREREEAFEQASQAAGAGQGQQRRYAVANRFTTGHRRQYHPRHAA